ncbi:hypothetical protein CSE15_02235 [Bacillus altitudinis]|nr:hypothetical protein CSE15_02235 [Bacillus altitudinis]
MMTQESFFRIMLIVVVLLIANCTGFIIFDWIKLSDFALPILCLLGSWVLAKFDNSSGSTP